MHVILSAQHHFPTDYTIYTVKVNGEVAGTLNLTNAEVKELQEGLTDTAIELEVWDNRPKQLHLQY